MGVCLQFKELVHDSYGGEYSSQQAGRHGAGAVVESSLPDAQVGGKQRDMPRIVLAFETQIPLSVIQLLQEGHPF